jgi:diadenosine tetraphosphate (Ap4A) HIT family hydrolase
MEKLYGAHKMNVAALGNQVPQLHVHIIARFTADPAWPTPIWGKGAPEPYGDSELPATVAKLKAALEL